jgi:hypothetical protein
MRTRCREELTICDTRILQYVLAKVLVELEDVVLRGGG